MSKCRSGTMLVLFGAIFWGMSGVAGQYLFQTKGVTAGWLVPIRLTCAGTLMLLMELPKQRRNVGNIFKNKKDTLTLLLFAIFGMMACQYTYFYTIELSNAGTATVLQYLSPVFVMAALCVLNKELPGKPELLAVCSALAGVFLLATHGSFRTLVITPQTLIWGIISAFTVVFYNLLPAGIIRKYTTSIVLGWAMLIGGVLLALIMRPWQYSPVMDMGTFTALFVIIILGTIVSFSFYLYGMTLIGAEKASIYACLEPLASTVFSALLLGTVFTTMDYAGLFFVCLTIFILYFGRRKEGVSVN